MMKEHYMNWKFVLDKGIIEDGGNLQLYDVYIFIFKIYTMKIFLFLRIPRSKFIKRIRTDSKGDERELLDTLSKCTKY